MNDPFARRRPRASQWLLGGKIGKKLTVLQGCCLGVSKEVERWPE